MIRIEWQGQPLTVRRLVFRSADWPNDGAVVHALADRVGLDTAADTVAPRPGDFWLGHYPRTGWADVPPAEVGWAHGTVVPVALAGIERGVRVAAVHRPAAREPRPADGPYLVVN